MKRNEASSGQMPVRVLDLGRFFSAPSVATQLGDFGAEVVKIESPDGGILSGITGSDSLA